MRTLLASIGSFFTAFEEENVIVKTPEEAAQEIHDEFDSAFDRENAQIQALLDSIDVPTESKLEDLGKRLKDLGFTGAAPVIKANQIVEKRKVAEKKVKLLKAEAYNLREMQEKYPLSKFLTVRELKRICEKYNLIYAPVARYKGDVPEKNIIEIENRKLLGNWDGADNQCWYQVTEFYDNVSKKARKALTEPILCTTDSIYPDTEIKRYLDTLDIDYPVHINRKGIKTVIERKGLQICAPLKDFHTEGLVKQEFGYAFVNKQEIDDPIVFEFCKNDIVRIITKWGPEGSDESLINPIEN